MRHARTRNSSFESLSRSSVSFKDWFHRSVLLMELLRSLPRKHSVEDVRFHRSQRRSVRPVSRTLLIAASCNALRRTSCNACSMPIRALIVDDNQAFLEAARMLLEREGLTVAGLA